MVLLADTDADGSVSLQEFVMLMLFKTPLSKKAAA